MVALIIVGVMNMTDGVLETQNNTFNQDNASTNKHLLAIAQETSKKLQQLKEEIQKKLSQIKFELEINGSETKETLKLKDEELYYSKALEEIQVLEVSVTQKTSELQKSKNNTDFPVKDVIVDVKLAKNDKTSENKEEADAKAIMKLRGLSPKNNIHIHQENQGVLQLIKADISYMSLNQRSKIGKLRNGTGAYHLGNRKSNSRQERQLTKKERERYLTYSRSHTKERGEHTR